MEGFLQWLSMKQKRKLSVWLKILIYTTIFIVLVFIGNALLKSVIEKKIHTTANKFAPYIKTNFKTIHINLLAASLNFDSITIQYQPNQSIKSKHQIFFKNVAINGINFFKLIGGKNFSASSCKTINGKISLDKYLLNSNDSLPANILS